MITLLHYLINLEKQMINYLNKTSWYYLFIVTKLNKLNNRNFNGMIIH